MNLDITTKALEVETVHLNGVAIGSVSVKRDQEGTLEHFDALVYGAPDNRDDTSHFSGGETHELATLWVAQTFLQKFCREEELEDVLHVWGNDR